MNYNKLLLEAHKEVEQAKQASQRSTPKISNEQMITLFKLRIKKQMAKSRNFGIYHLNAENKNIIKQFCLYLRNDETCKLDLNKGILLMGNVGTGKTLLMDAFISAYNDLNYHKAKSMLSTDYIAKMRNNEPLKFGVGPVFLDDIGKGADHIKVFGSDVCPVTEFITSRYYESSLTFATGNYRISSYEERYGAHTADRMKEMFNIVVLEGSSRR